jgi:hypothetical protein
MTATVMEKVKIKHTDFARDVRELQRKKEIYHPSVRDISRMFKVDVAVLVLLYAASIIFGVYAKEHAYSLVASLPAIFTLLLFSVFLIRFAFKAHNFDHARADNCCILKVLIFLSAHRALYGSRSILRRIISIQTLFIMVKISTPRIGKCFFQSAPTISEWMLSKQVK